MKQLFGNEITFSSLKIPTSWYSLDTAHMYVYIICVRICPYVLCKYVRVILRMHACLCLYMLSVGTYVHIYICTNVCKYVCTYTYIYKCVCNTNISVYYMYNGGESQQCQTYHWLKNVN